MKLAFPVATPETHDETMLALRGGLEANFDRLAELGYHGVELMVRQPAELDGAGIRSAARARSLQVVAVSTGQLRKEDGLQLCALDRETLTWIDGFAGPGRPRILFDTYHAMLEERSIAASLIRAIPHVSYVQVADSNRLAPGQGHLPLADFVRVLRALRYDGFVGVEVLQKPSGLAAARAAALALRPLLDEP